MRCRWFPDAFLPLPQVPQYRKGHWRGVFRMPLASQLFRPLLAPDSGAHAGKAGAPSWGEAELRRLATCMPPKSENLPSPDYDMGAEGALMATSFFDQEKPDMVSGCVGGCVHCVPCTAIMLLPLHPSAYFHARTNTRQVTWPSIWQRLSSKSYIATLPEAQRAQLRQQVLGVVAAHAHLFAPPAIPPPAAAVACKGAEEGGGAEEGLPAGLPPRDWTIPLPLQTEVSWCIRSGP